MFTSYTRLIQAEHQTVCANCGQECIPNDWIYLHGRSIACALGVKSFSPNTHKGCFWDERKDGGFAPYLTWKQIVAMAGAINAKDLPTQDERVRRFLGAVRVAMDRREQEMYTQDHDCGFRFGPALLEGYRLVLKALKVAKDPMWLPVNAGGGSRWVNPEKAREQAEQRPPLDEAAHMRAYREKHYRAAR